MSGSGSPHAGADLEERAAVILVRLSLLCLAFFTVKAADRWGPSWLPSCGAVILVGFVFGAAMSLVDPGFEERADALDADTFLLFILPPIIFDAGFNLTSQGGRISRNAGAILMFAIVGTLLSSLVVGVGTFVYSEIADGAEIGTKLNFWEALAFGSLISAIDPVATLAVLGEVFPGPKPKMYFLVFGESVINDAVAVVLYKVCNEFSDMHEEGGSSFSAPLLLQAVFRFAVIFVGSTVVAVVIDLVFAAILRWVDLRQYPAMEITMMVVSSVGMYSVSEFMGLSGIMTVFVGGRLAKHWVLHNVSLRSRVLIPNLVHVIAEICDMYVFAFLGAAFFVVDLNWCPVLIVTVFVLIVAGRAVNIFPISALCNAARSPSERISKQEQVFMWTSGLRGAIAFVLATLGESSGKSSLVTVTLVMVVISVMLFGGAAKPLLHHLNLASAGEDHQRQINDSIGSRDGSGPRPRGAAAWGHITRWFRAVLHVDGAYVMPWVCRDVSGEAARETLCRALLSDDLDGVTDEMVRAALPVPVDDAQVGVGWAGQKRRSVFALSEFTDAGDSASPQRLRGAGFESVSGHDQGTAERHATSTSAESQVDTVVV